MSRYARALASVYPVLFGGRKYSRSLLSLFSGSIIAYWPLWEASGSVAYDISGNARNGSYTGVTLGQPGIGDGHTSPLFDGTNDFVNIYSAGLAGAFNQAEGSILIWAKVFDSSVWEDGLNRTCINLGVDTSSNYIGLLRATANNRLVLNRAGGGTLRQVQFNGVTTLDWFHFAAVWSTAGNAMNAYLNGVAGIEVAPTAIVGSLNSARCNIGSSIITPIAVWNGYLAHALLLNRAATPAEIAQAATL